MCKQQKIKEEMHTLCAELTVQLSVSHLDTLLGDINGKLESHELDLVEKKKVKQL